MSSLRTPTLAMFPKRRPLPVSSVTSGPTSYRLLITISSTPATTSSNPATSPRFNRSFK